MSLEKKVILVTGAARGIGREYCQRLAALGAAVMAVDINACDETIEFIKRAGGRALAAKSRRDGSCVGNERGRRG